MRLSVCILALLLLPWVSFAQSKDEQIKSLCGTHPVVSYLGDYKGILMDPQILTDAEECAEGVVGATVWKWKLADANIQGCLKKRYGYQEEYIKNIAKQFDDARDMVADQIAPYNSCANDVRRCGKHPCEGTPSNDKEAEPGVSFSVQPQQSKPGQDVTLNFDNYVGRRFDVYMAGRSLPKKTSADGRTVTVTVPGDTVSGEYTIEVIVNDTLYQAQNSLEVTNPFDNLSFSFSPTQIRTGQQIYLFLSAPLARHFDVYLYGNSGRVNWKLPKNAVQNGGRQIVVTVPDNIPDGDYSLYLRGGTHKIAGNTTLNVDNPRSHRAPASN